MNRAANFISKDDGMRNSAGGSRPGMAMSIGLAKVRVIGVVLFGLLGITVQGCSLFHHGAPPQQQFMNALNRGNGAEASHLWLTMSAKDRANFTHNVGLKPNLDENDIARRLFKHQQEQQAKENAEDPDPLRTGEYNDAGSDQQVEIPGNPTGNLSNLSSFAAQPSATTTEFGPQ